LPSTYSPSLRLELIGSGEQSGTWGTTTNNNLGTLLEQAITGVQTINMFDANYTLSNYNGVSDEARKAVLVVTGNNTAVRDIIAPLASKVYIVKNGTSGGYAINVRASSGASVSVPNGTYSTVYCDGANFYTTASSGSGVNSVTAGTGITVTGTSTAPIINNAGVNTITAGSGISIGGTSTNPTISASGTAGVTTFSGGTTGLTPNVATTGDILLAGTLNAVNGGSGRAGTLTGVLYGNGTSAQTVATAAQIVSAIGTTAVTNATTATTATTAASCTGNAATVTNGVYLNTNNTHSSGANTFPTGVGINAANPNPSLWGLYAKSSGNNPAIFAESSNVFAAITVAASAGGAMAFYYGVAGSIGSLVGSISLTSTSTAYNTASDYRLKTNVIPVVNAADRVKQLKPCNFTWIKEPSLPAVDGFLAHELADVIPVATTGKKDAVDDHGNPIYQAIDQAKIVPLLTAALQEALARIEALEAKNAI
jgi:hypothetical protein